MADPSIKADDLMEHFLEGIASISHCYINFQFLQGNFPLRDLLKSPYMYF